VQERRHQQLLHGIEDTKWGKGKMALKDREEWRGG